MEWQAVLHVQLHSLAGDKISLQKLAMVLGLPPLGYRLWCPGKGQAPGEQFIVNAAIIAERLHLYAPVATHASPEFKARVKLWRSLGFKKGNDSP